MTRKRGGVSQRADGTWLARVTLKGKGRKSLGSYATREEAETVVAGLVQIAESGTNEQVLRFGAFGRKWIESRQASGIVRARNELRNWAKYVEGTKLGKLALTAIRRRDVRAWIEDLANLSPTHWQAGKRVANRRLRISDETKAGLVRLVTQALGRAVDDEQIKANPALGLKARKSGRSDEAWTFLAPAEQTALLVSVPQPEQAIVATAIGTGLRLSELWALRLVDVHLEGDDPHLSVRYGGRGAKVTKSKKPRRVPLFGLGLAGLRAWIPTLAGRENPLGLVFPSTTGEHRDRKSPRDWPAWKKAAGISRRVRWHDLRHTCASSLVAGWWGRRWSLIEVRNMLGHSTIKVTERYAHIADDVLTEAAREMPAVDDSGSRSGSAEQAVITKPLENQSGKPDSNRRHQPWQGESIASIDNDLPPADPGLILTRLAVGDPAAVELAKRLAREVLAWPEVALAVRVLDEEDDVVATAIELVRRVIEVKRGKKAGTL